MQRGPMTRHTPALVGVFLAALTLSAAPAKAADPGGQPSAQDYRDRLLGREAPPSNGTSPSRPAGTPDCATQEALENNPACFNQVSGADRGFSLVAPHGSSGRGAAASPQTTRPGRPARPAVAAASRSPRGGGGGDGCGLGDSASARGANLCITFALNSSVLSTTARSHLDRLFEALSTPELRGRKLLIEGYADVSGNAQANLTLSEERARSAADYLVSKGLRRDQVSSQGFGSTHLLPGRAATDPANRRVEAQLKD